MAAKLLDEINRLREDPTGMDEYERLLLKMFGNLLESYHEVRAPKSRLTVDEYVELPGRWELMNGMLHDDGMRSINEPRDERRPG
jgi:hypothetical protein